MLPCGHHASIPSPGSATTVTFTLNLSLGAGRTVAAVTAEVPKPKLPPARGSSHAFKSAKPCSQRSQVYTEILNRKQAKSATSTGKQGQKFRHKERKIANLKMIRASMTKAIPSYALEKSLHMYSNQPNPDLKLLDLQQFDIVDEMEGCRLMDSANKDIVFVLLPRKEVLKATGKSAHPDVCALKKLQDAKGSTPRSATREGKCEGKYSTTGIAANRGGHGIVQCKFAEKDVDAYNRLVKMMKRCQELAAGYICCGLLQGLADVMNISKCPTVRTTPRKEKKEAPAASTTSPSGSPCPAKEKKQAPTIFAALANAINYWSPAHLDPDFFLSLLTVNVEGLVSKDTPEYRVDAPIVHHFVFPEYGIAVALRPGDMLLFNPQHYHCLSQKEVCYDGQRVHVTSFYLKTAVISKNDNRIPLSKEEEEVLASIKK
jgi:hypothetical protein